MKKNHALILAAALMMSAGIGGYQLKNQRDKKKIKTLIENTILPNAEKELNTLVLTEQDFNDSIAHYSEILSERMNGVRETNPDTRQKLDSVLAAMENVLGDYYTKYWAFREKKDKYYIGDGEYDVLPPELNSENQYFENKSRLSITVPLRCTEHYPYRARYDGPKQKVFNEKYADNITDFGLSMRLAIQGVYEEFTVNDDWSYNNSDPVDVRHDNSPEQLRRIAAAMSEFVKYAKQSPDIFSAKNIAKLEKAIKEFSDHINVLENAQKKQKSFKDAKSDVSKRIKTTQKRIRDLKNPDILSNWEKRCD